MLVKFKFETDFLVLKDEQLRELEVSFKVTIYEFQEYEEDAHFLAQIKIVARGQLNHFMHLV